MSSRAFYRLIKRRLEAIHQRQHCWGGASPWATETSRHPRQTEGGELFWIILSGGREYNLRELASGQITVFKQVSVQCPWSLSVRLNLPLKSATNVWKEERLFRRSFVFSWQKQCIPFRRSVEMQWILFLETSEYHNSMQFKEPTPCLHYDLLERNMHLLSSWGRCYKWNINVSFYNEKLIEGLVPVGMLPVHTTD